jgi:hypothetical protein
MQLSFSLSGRDAPELRLSQQRSVGAVGYACSPLAPSGSCGFTTGGSARKLTSRRAVARSALLCSARPFASLSLAAVTLSAPAPPKAPETKPKKSIGDVLSMAGKLARLRQPHIGWGHGCPGVVSRPMGCGNVGSA